MMTDYARLVGTAARLYAGCLSATAELAAHAMRAAAADASEVTEGAAAVLRAPEAQRGAAVEAVLLTACEAQRRQLHAMRGAGPYWSMAVLSNLRAWEARQPDPR